MATVNFPELANLDANIANRVEQCGGRIRQWSGNLALTAANLADTNVLMFAELPSHATIVALFYFHDDLNSAGGAMNGDTRIYDLNDIVISPANPFHTNAGVNLGSATSLAINHMDDTGGKADLGQPLWALLTTPPTVNPGVNYRIGLEVNSSAATPAAGAFAYQIHYSVD